MNILNAKGVSAARVVVKIVEHCTNFDIPLKGRSELSCLLRVINDRQAVLDVLTHRNM